MRQRRGRTPNQLILPQTLSDPLSFSSLASTLEVHVLDSFKREAPFRLESFPALSSFVVKLSWFCKFRFWVVGASGCLLH